MTTLKQLLCLVILVLTSDTFCYSQAPEITSNGSITVKCFPRDLLGVGNSPAYVNFIFALSLKDSTYVCYYNYTDSLFVSHFSKIVERPEALVEDTTYNALAFEATRVVLLSRGRVVSCIFNFDDMGHIHLNGRTRVKDDELYTLYKNKICKCN